MKIYLLFVLVMYSGLSYAQSKEQTIKRFHKNKRLSTIETWDKERRTGRFLCLNSKGDTLLNYQLRNYEGYAKVKTQYYSNGQVKKTEFKEVRSDGELIKLEEIDFDSRGKSTGESVIGKRILREKD